VTKNDVKALCEADEKLQWWAMVLFAEIMEVGTGGYSTADNVIAEYVRAKVAEFPRLVIQRQIEKANEGGK
jgi:hypothetical protein